MKIEWAVNGTKIIFWSLSKHLGTLICLLLILFLNNSQKSHADGNQVAVYSSVCSSFSSVSVGSTLIS